MRFLRSNLVLIGMPGAGKSTVGIVLAKAMSYDFVDTDVLIQTKEKRSLQDIVDAEGHIQLRHIEEQILLNLFVDNYVIATGGSAAYSKDGMRHLKSNGIVIFLDVALDTLKSRIHNYTTRGIAKRPDQSFEDLFKERFELYTHYADITIPCDGLNQEQVCENVIQAVNRFV